MNAARTRTITRTQLRFAILGFTLAIAAMVAVFVAGAVTGSAQMMVIASSTFAALGGSAAAMYASVAKKVQR